MNFTGNQNFSSIVTRGASNEPDKVVITYQDKKITYRTLQERVSALSQGLLKLGIKKDDIVAVLLYNCSEYLEILFAVNRIGAIFLPLNFRLAAYECAGILEDSGAKVIISEDSFHLTLNSIRDGVTNLQHFITLSPKPADDWIFYEKMLADNLGADIPDAHVEFEDLHRLMYTSGTTSRPKGVMITYGNLYWKNIGHIWEFDITAQDKTLIAGPLYHVGGLDLTATSTLYRGGSVVILRKFDALEVVKTIEKEKTTGIWLAPAMTNIILQEPKAFEYQLDSIRYIIGGGERMPEPLVIKVQQLFKNAWFCDAYGLTETVSGDTFLPKNKTLEKLGSVGLPCIHLDVKIVDKDGNVRLPNQVGEITFRGPKVTKGYWKNPEATKKAIRNGWFHTGDIGRMDDEGYLYIVDRKKDMIISGGENIASLEVERILFEHPYILEASVIGIPHEKWGEVPKAFVVLKPGYTLSAEEVKQHCMGKLAKFKVPKEVEFINELPRNPSGKVLKRLLRKEEQGGMLR
ncbi:acyl-CoA synthetase [Jeotgalibacillus soli]|uniref:Acyl-CoA synthetase n=1 Tax=Jeotgalibacillus soli TaxID=889306 RepID=A0A0C2VLR0_9BACL|nr:long-chain fatty acid--CoA ligase [Jeotgalibacillus soli]KIL45401.1 acyl-CoA synthetase [Jeotgalibacillus soli]